MKTSSDKTKIFLVNYQFSNQLTTSLRNLEIVEDFKYLGAKSTMILSGDGVLLRASSGS